MAGLGSYDLKSLLAHPLKRGLRTPGLEFRLCVHELAQQSPRFPHALLRGTEAPQKGLRGTCGV